MVLENMVDAEINITFTENITSEYQEILSPEAIAFFVKLENKYRKKRKALLEKRKQVQQNIDNGIFPDFLPETKPIRESNWKINPVLDDLQDRRVEITGPVDRKMIINALNSGVKVFMADIEDSNSPTWENIINGQINLKDAVQKTIDFKHPTKNKTYKLNDEIATLMVRPRGFHLEEKHILIDNEPVSASIFDFAIFFFHNAKTLISNGTGPYFYLPKLESHLEARLWNDIFIDAQNDLNIPQGKIKATVLIETILAAFEMDEILFELKEHSAGLNCGRWDYIFSFIKKFRNFKNFILPDRSAITMERHFMNSYVQLLIQTCHKRGAHAMGGMAAQIPIRGDETANKSAMDKVLKDKLREAEAGHDGTWIAHPGLAPFALKAFDKRIGDRKNQLNILREDVKINQEDLLKVPKGNITEDGIRHNIRVGIQYIHAWVNGNGCVPLYNLMEDAATAEICRSQLWQWLHNKVLIENNKTFNTAYFTDLLNNEIESLKLNLNQNDDSFNYSVKLFTDLILNEKFEEFLTIPAYNQL
jgi:malate synthase